MPPEKPGPPNRAWRNAAKPAAGKNDAQKAWRREPTAPTKVRSGMSRRAKAGLLGLGSLGIVGLIILIIWWLRPIKPVYVVLIGAGYETNLAVDHNVFGLTAQKQFEELTTKNQSLRDQFKVARYGADSWDKALVDSGKEKTIVVYLALHGGADKKRGPYLILDTTTPGTKGQGLLPVKDVLDRLRKLPEDKKKLLILDAAQPQSARRLMIYNDFSRELKLLDPAIKKIPNLVVFNASDAYQRSWASEEWRQTAFGFYLQEGLKGGAGSGRVTAWKLYQFVRQKVERWAHDNREAAQTPLLLPLGEEGEGRAQAMELAPVEEDYKEPSVPTAAPISQEKLAQACGEAEKLLARVPSPAVYSPHVLTQYLETLVRYEQLVRAGDKDHSAALFTELNRLGGIMRANQRLDLPSAKNALPLPAVLGLLDGSAPDDEDRFKELWKADKGRRIPLWSALQQSSGADNVLPVKLSAWLMQKALDDPRDLPKACEILAQLLDKAGDRPTEAHHMVMWQRDLEHLYQKELPADLERALRLRRYAEEVALGVVGKPLDPRNKDDGIERTGVERLHPYSEIVKYWIKAQVDQADDLRREAQDLLFSAAQPDREEAGKRITEAGKAYTEALKTAEKVRKALEARSEVMALLPFYTRWLAGRRPHYDRTLSDLKEHQDKAVALWKAVHELNALLAEPLAAGKVKADIGRLTDLTRQVREGFQAVKDFFDQHWRKDWGQLQSDWHGLELALTVPLIPANRRMELLEKARKASHTLNVNTGPKVGIPLDSPPADREAQESAYRQGRLEVAMLGQGLFGKTNEPGRDDLDKVEVLIKDIRGDHWEDTAAQLSAQTALRWQEMAGAINKNTEDSRNQANLDQAAALLASADGWCRQIDGAGAAEVKSTPYNPVEEGRRLNLHRLFLWLAERSLKDRWFDEKNLPYYRAIGLRYVDDAEKLAGDKDNPVHDQRLTLAKTRRQELMKQVPLDFAWSLRDKDYQPLPPKVPATVHVTSEKDFALHYRVDHPENLPSGAAVVYFEPTGITATVPAELAALQKPQVRRLGIKESLPVKVTGLVNPHYQDLFRPEKQPVIATDVTPATCVMNGLWRGYRFHRDTAVHFHPRGNVIVYQNPLPDRAGLYVYAEDAVHRRYNPQEGTLAIVVDYSASMEFNIDRKDKKSPTRIVKAKEALRKMLASLPDNLEVSLWTFHGPKFKNQFKGTVTMVADTPAWQGNGDVKKVMAALDKEKPDGGTPLLEAMSDARDKLLDSKRKGRRTMVVLTDGVPNDPLDFITGKRNLQRELNRLFDGKGILVHVVGFQVSKIDPEVDGQGARRVLKLFQKAIQQPPISGRFHPVEDADKLAEVLNETLKWNYRVADPQKRREKPAKGEAPLTDDIKPGVISRKLYLNYWLSVRPRTYAFWEDKLFPDEKQTITLDPGELGMYELWVSGDAKGLRRASFLDRLGQGNWPVDQKLGWRLAAGDNLKLVSVQSKRQKLLVLVENSLPARAEPRRQARPDQVWLEFQQPDGTPVSGVRWGNSLGYPASAWQVEATRYPDKPRGKVWSKVQAWVRATEIGAEPVRRNNQPLTAFEDRKVVVSGVETFIESVTVEKFAEVDPLGQRNWNKEMWCLVVRLNYPKDEPVFADPELNVDKRRLKGYEHHYYTDAGGRGKYTGIFWYGPGTQGEVDGWLEAINLFSVNRLKKDPQTTQKLSFELGEPAENLGNRIPRFLEKLNLE
jgi:hypothetical protein